MTPAHQPPDHQSPDRHNERGFTLVELTVSIAVFIVVITIALGQMTSGVAQTRNVDSATNRASSARVVVDSLVGELRQAWTGTSSLAPITSASSTAITFHSPDRRSPASLRRIQYRLTAGTLERSEVVSTNTGAAPWTFPVAAVVWQPVLSNITNTDLFVYLTSTGAVVSSPAQTISAITLHFDIPSTITRGTDSMYRTRVDIRGSH